jgi:hypothetical protein
MILAPLNHRSDALAGFHPSTLSVVPTCVKEIPAWGHSRQTGASAPISSAAIDPQRKWRVHCSSRDNSDLCGGRGTIMVHRDRLACTI